MDAHLTLKDHHNRRMKKNRAAEAPLCALIKTHGIILDKVTATKIGYCQAVRISGCELCWDQRVIARLEDCQLLHNYQARLTCDEVTETSMDAQLRDSGLTSALVALDPRPRRFSVRLATVCEVSQVKGVHDHHTSDGGICRVITIEHEQYRGAETWRQPNHNDYPALKMVPLCEATAAMSKVIR
jgi:hypothetical protein